MFRTASCLLLGCVLVIKVIPAVPEKNIGMAVDPSGTDALSIVPCKSHNDCLQISSGHACFFNGEKVGYCFPNDNAAFETSSFIQIEDETTSRPAAQGSQLGNGELHIQSEKGEKALLKISSGTSSFSLGVREGNFVIRNPSDKDVLTLGRNGDVTFDVPDIHGNSLFASKSLATNGNAMWRIVHKSNFEESPTGWEPATLTPNAGLVTLGVSSCSGVHMLGGYRLFDKPGSVSKDFTIARPASKRSVRIVANFHFIDDWSGQSAYLQVAQRDSSGAWAPASVVWAQQYAYDSTGAQATANTDADLNACGNSLIGEHLFASHIDAVVALESAGGDDALQLKLVFGTTWQPSLTGGALPGSWGISGLKIMAR